ncbi:MAG: DUF748 domain-containing protein [Salinivirgaceae bacterium]|nr:DUF748 domain-containing protein [Salinivirgaceae bacterium]
MLYSKENKKRKLLQKTTIILLIFSGLMLAILFTSSIVSKYVIKKYDVEYLGRNVELGWVYANPLTGYIYVRNLKIYESTTLPSLASSDSLFFMAKGVRLNIAMHKLLTKTIEISSLQIDQPKVQLIQNKSAFNFTDLIHKFSIKPTDTIQSKVKFNLLNFKIVDGNLQYCETIIPINYIIKDININSLGMRWNVDSIPMNFAFKSQTGKGSIVGNITINTKSNDYNLAFQASKFDLNILDQYLAELTNYSTLSATLDADFSSKGNFKHPEKVTNKGVIIINDCNLGKNHIDSYLKFSTLVLAMKEVSPHDSIYWYDSIILTKPYIKFEQFDNSDNFQQMFGANWSNISKIQTDSTRFNLILKIVDYLEILRKNFLISDFKIGKVVIREGVVKYDDYTLSEKFSLEANPFYLAVDSIYKDRNRVQFYVKTGIHPFGNLSAQIDLNPENRNNFELKYHLKGLPVSVFNPYLITYTSFPLNKGTLELEGNWNVKNGDINSINHLIIIDPQI